MLVVHHLNNSRSQRILWLLEELGLPYEIRRYQRDAKTLLAPPELKAVHPLGKSPVVTDGDRVLAESGAIIEYLVEAHGNGALQPGIGTEERIRYRYWLHFAEGSMMSPLLLKLVFERIPKSKMPFFAKPIASAISQGALKTFVAPQIERLLDFIEGELGKTPWFAGDHFTAADIQMSFPLEVSQARVGFGNRLKLEAFVQRIQARPAYRRAVERGGEYGIVS